jgi:hypothetical protein
MRFHNYTRISRKIDMHFINEISFKIRRTVYLSM